MALTRTSPPFPAVVFAVLATASLVAAWPAAAAGISPAAGTDAVRAAHSGTEGELRLTYRRESDGHAPETLTASLAKNYSAQQLDSPDTPGLTVFDYGLRRVYRVEPGNVFVNDSLYAYLWFRGAELNNRAVMANALAKAGLGAKAPWVTSPFWNETFLGLTSAKLLPRPALRRVEEGGRTRWLLDDQEVAAVRYGATAVPVEVRAVMRRLWIGQVHPAIAADLAASARVPEELWIRRPVFGREAPENFETWHWTLQSSQWVQQAQFPLPAGLPASPSLAKGAFREVFATLTAAVANHLQPPPEKVYLQRAQEAIARNAGLESLIWGIELRLARGTPAANCQPQDPDPACALAAQAGPSAKADPRTAVAFQQKSPAMSDRAPFDSLPNAYLLRLLWATRPAGAGVDFAENERGILAALKASPVANFCKDTGDLYLQAHEAFAGWQAYDLGRQMAGHRQDDLLSSVDKLEAQLAAAMPDEL